MSERPEILNKMESKLADLEHEITALQKARSECESVIKEEKRKLTYQNTDVTITDHAVLRYFERIKGYDISEIRKTILPDEVKEQIHKLGGGEYPVNGFSIVVKNKRVVTVIT